MESLCIWVGVVAIHHHQAVGPRFCGALSTAESHNAVPEIRYSLHQQTVEESVAETFEAL